MELVSKHNLKGSLNSYHRDTTTPKSINSIWSVSRSNRKWYKRAFQLSLANFWIVVLTLFYYFSFPISLVVVREERIGVIRNEWTQMFCPNTNICIHTRYILSFHFHRIISSVWRLDLCAILRKSVTESYSFLCFVIVNMIF